MIGFGIFASGDGFQIAQEALAQHEDAAIARAQVLLGPVGDGSLPHPGDEILIHDVARDPAAGLPHRAPGRAMPGSRSCT